MHDHSKRIETLKQNPWINISKDTLENCRRLKDKKTESLLINHIIQKVCYFEVQYELVDLYDNRFCHLIIINNITQLG